MLLWLLFTSTVNPGEAVVGVAVAAIAATATTLVRSKNPFLFQPRLRWLLLVGRLPVAIASDTWTVMRVLVLHLSGRRRVRGTLRALPFPYGDPDSAEDGARRALAATLVSMTPNSVVLGFDRERGEIVYHRLGPARKDPKALLPPP